MSNCVICGTSLPAGSPNWKTKCVTCFKSTKPQSSLPASPEQGSFQKESSNHERPTMDALVVATNKAFAELTMGEMYRPALIEKMLEVVNR